MKIGTITVLLLVAGALFAQDEEDEKQVLDRLLTVDGRKRVEVRHENLDRLIYRHLRSQRDKEMPWSMVQKIEYDGMDSGYYAAGMKQMAASNFDEAAEHFKTLAAHADGREWPAAYGIYHAGRCLEKAGRFDQAAGMFAAFCAAHPQHRWWQNAKYYEGINWARQGKTAEAKAAIDALIAYGQDKQNRIIVGRRAEMRANCIKAVLLAMDGKIEDAIDLTVRISFGKGEEEIAYHWDNFWAYFLLDRERYTAAADAFAQLQKKAAGDPVREAEISIGYGRALMQAENYDGALLQFLKLDILPYGTPAQRCQAQFYAGKVLLKLAARNAGDDANEAQKELAATQKEQAKLLLGSCLANPVSLPEKQEAKELMDKYYPPPAPPEEAKAPAAGSP